MTAIHLGYEVGTGAAVEIPLRHLVITGQTQEAGKTTALEALVQRSGVKAVVFVTKRGEGSFADARVIAPYFREEVDWQFVASILEASRGEKLKFERAWIIRASKGARTLADVQRNVQRAMKTAKRMSADVYLTLDAYLDAVVPQIAAVRWASTVDLAPGVNAMDLVGLNVEMQHLVIRSTIDWVLRHETGAVVVVPEAWKFIPQGRGTPVKLAAESYIRQAAGLRNYLWLDSQDIAGVEKIILKSVPVWILGVQREANEVRRTLDQIPAGISKPKPADIATLELGQFYACWGRHAVKTYVQPAWMPPGTALHVAMGELSVADASPPARTTTSTEDDTVNEAEARRLRAENEELRARVQELEAKFAKVAPVTASADRIEQFARRGQAAQRAADTAIAEANGKLDHEALYQSIKRRLIQEAASDPAILRVLTRRPEIEVVVEREVIEADGYTLRGRIARLIAEGFFDDAARTAGDVFKELQSRGGKDAVPGVANELQYLTTLGFFTRDNKWYRLVPNSKVNVVEAG